MDREYEFSDGDFVRVDVSAWDDPIASMDIQRLLASKEVLEKLRLIYNGPELDDDGNEIYWLILYDVKALGDDNEEKIFWSGWIRGLLYPFLRPWTQDSSAMKDRKEKYKRRW